MRKYLGILLGFALLLPLEVWGMDGKSSAQAAPSTYVVCAINGNTQTTALVQSLKTSSPVTFSASLAGPPTITYYAIFQLSTPQSCLTLYADSQEAGPYPPGINIEADTSHKPVLKVA